MNTIREIIERGCDNETRMEKLIKEGTFYKHFSIFDHENAYVLRYLLKNITSLLTAKEFGSSRMYPIYLEKIVTLMKSNSDMVFYSDY